MREKKDASTVAVDLAGLIAGLQKASELTAPVRVDMPEFGGALYVAALGTAEWLDTDRPTALPDGATADHRRGWNVARWICDESGRRIVQPDNLAALELFAKLPWRASERILRAAGVFLDGDAEKNA